jgi:hypothetical protein
MNDRKIKLTSDVRVILGQLAAAFDRYGALTRILADPKSDPPQALSAGADREANRRDIVNIAWRLHCASVGRNPADYYGDDEAQRRV